MKEPKRYYNLVEDTENDSADLYIFGDITSWGQWGKDDPDRSAYNIVNELKAVSASNINVHINSYGGDVSEGLAIYNTLKNSKKNITTICDGFACSAASVVFMAGQQRVMSPASLLMIHNAWTCAIGNSAELRKQADDLETITQASVEAYKQVAVVSEEKIKELMDNETWILPEDAKEYGFATEVLKEDEEDQPRQSAFRMIMEKLTSNVFIEPVSEPVREAVMIDEEAIAAGVAQRVIEALNPEPKEPKQANDGWKSFFKS